MARKTRRSSCRPPACRDATRASAGAFNSIVGSMGTSGGHERRSRLYCGAAHAALRRGHAPRAPQPLVRRSRGAEGRRAGARQAAEAARPDSRRRPRSTICRPVRSSESARRARAMRCSAGSSSSTSRRSRFAQRAGRGPFRVYASDRAGNTITPDLFQQSRLGEEAASAGRDRSSFPASSRPTAQEWQIVHPEVPEPGKAADCRCASPSIR